MLSRALSWRSSAIVQPPRLYSDSEEHCHGFRSHAELLNEQLSEELVAARREAEQLREQLKAAQQDAKAPVLDRPPSSVLTDFHLDDAAPAHTAAVQPAHAPERLRYADAAVQSASERQAAAEAEAQRWQQQACELQAQVHDTRHQHTHHAGQPVLAFACTATATQPADHMQWPDGLPQQLETPRDAPAAAPAQAAVLQEQLASAHNQLQNLEAQLQALEAQQRGHATAAARQRRQAAAAAAKIAVAAQCSAAEVHALRLELRRQQQDTQLAHQQWHQERQRAVALEETLLGLTQGCCEFSTAAELPAGVTGHLPAAAALLAAPQAVAVPPELTLAQDIAHLEANLESASCKEAALLGGELTAIPAQQEQQALQAQQAQLDQQAQQAQQARQADAKQECVRDQLPQVAEVAEEGLAEEDSARLEAARVHGHTAATEVQQLPQQRGTFLLAVDVPAGAPAGPPEAVAASVDAAQHVSAGSTDELAERRVKEGLAAPVQQVAALSQGLPPEPEAASLEPQRKADQAAAAGGKESVQVDDAQQAPSAVRAALLPKSVSVSTAERSVQPHSAEPPTAPAAQQVVPVAVASGAARAAQLLLDESSPSPPSPPSPRELLQGHRVTLQEGTVAEATAEAAAAALEQQPTAIEWEGQNQAPATELEHSRQKGKASEDLQQQGGQLTEPCMLSDGMSTWGGGREPAKQVAKEIASASSPDSAGNPSRGDSERSTRSSSRSSYGSKASGSCSGSEGDGGEAVALRRRVRELEGQVQALLRRLEELEACSSQLCLPRAAVEAVQSLEAKLQEEQLSRRQMLQAYADSQGQVKKLTVQLNAAHSARQAQQAALAAEQARTASAVTEVARLAEQVQLQHAAAEATEEALAGLLARQLVQGAVQAVLLHQQHGAAGSEATGTPQPKSSGGRPAEVQAAASLGDIISTPSQASQDATAAVSPGKEPATPAQALQPRQQQEAGRAGQGSRRCGPGRQEEEEVEVEVPGQHATARHLGPDFEMQLELQRLSGQNVELRQQVADLEAALAEAAAVTAGHANPEQRVQYLQRVRSELEAVRRRCNEALRERFELEECIRYLAVRARLPGAASVRQPAASAGERSPASHLRPRSLAGHVPGTSAAAYQGLPPISSSPSTMAGSTVGSPDTQSPDRSAGAVEAAILSRVAGVMGASAQGTILQ